MNLVLVALRQAFQLCTAKSTFEVEVTKAEKQIDTEHRLWEQAKT